NPRHAPLERQAEKTPESTPLTGKWDTSSRELDAKSDQLAGRLQESGVGANDIVAVMLERSFEMVIGILGILKAGCAYLPIDPAYPADRIKYMLADSGARVLLSENIEVIDPAEITGKGYEYRPTQSTQAGPGNVAYIIYTSGSTGRPKGVMVEHRSVVNILFDLFKRYPFGEGDTYLLKTSYVFDVSVTELFGWFLGGGRLAVLEKGGEKDPQAILAAVEHFDVSHINFVPSMFNVFLESLASGNTGKSARLRYIFLAGEALLPRLVKVFAQLDLPASLENIYGPTEATVYASEYSLSQWDGSDSVPIGKPMQNTKLYILDKYGHIQPTGAAGELCISGTGLSRGYLNNPELTAEKFPPAGRPSLSTPLYHTGDLARWLPDGNVEFLGRIDHQVKIRGYRIELGEIEKQLTNHEDVEETVVTARESERGDKYLCAYIVPVGRVPGYPSVSQLQEYLSKHLPGYMVPMYYVFLEEIPLSPSGKVDRKSLPEPASSSDNEEYVAPGDEVQARVAAIWEEELDEAPIGIYDNFFKRGGHSLKAIGVANKIQKTFGVTIPIQALFQHPTIARISRLIESSRVTGFREIEKQPGQDHYELTYPQQRLWYITKTEPHNPLFNMPAKVTLYEAVDAAVVGKVLEQLVARHESLRTSFKEIEKQPVQVIEPIDRVTMKLDLEIIDWSELPGTQREANRNRLVPEESVHLFNLAEAPLFRAKVVKCAAEEYDLVFNMHHIISDGWSMEILKQEFRQLYDAQKI
ncbi:MAG: amino acid adenylation domain-containing protein, partial [bacterium]|nr:amino acid adenylation domain-containing protein [bacterium]